MEANPHHYSARAIKTARHALSLKGKMPIDIDRVIHEKTQAIKNSLWLPEEEKQQRKDIQHLKLMKKKWAAYYEQRKSNLSRMKKPADLKKLVERLDRN